MDHPAQTPAKELTKAEQQKLVDKAFKLERQIKSKRAAAHSAYWEMAKAAYEFVEIRGWTKLGYDSLAEFLAQPDLGLSQRQFFYALRTWRDLVLRKGLPPADLKEIEPTKVREVVPAIMSGKVKPEEALADAKDLSYKDVIEKYRPINQARHGQAPDGSTPLDASAEPQRVRCPTCRQWTTSDRLPEAKG